MRKKQYSYSTEPDEILIERSRELMQSTGAIHAKQITLISFFVGSIRYALNSMSVAQVIDSVDASRKSQDHSYNTNTVALSKLSILPVPQTQPFILGIVNIRGTLHTVIDLSQLLIQSPTSQSIDSQLILIQDDTYNVCILTGGKAETLILHEEDIQPARDTLPHQPHGIVSGAVPCQNSFIGLLDPYNLLRHQQLMALLQ